MKAIPTHLRFGFPIGRFGRLVGIVYRVCRVELAVGETERQEEAH